MDPELKKLLEENLRVAQDTNAILRSMRRQAQWGLVGKIILWVLVLIVPLFFIQSYLGPYMELLNGAMDGQQQQGNGNFDYQKLLDQYKELQ